MKANIPKKPEYLNVLPIQIKEIEVKKTLNMLCT